MPFATAWPNLPGPISPLTKIATDTGQTTVAHVTLAQIAQSAAPIYTALNNTTATTIPVATFCGGNGTNIINMTGTLGGAAALTVPTVAQCVAQYGGSFNAGMTWVMRVINSSAGAFAWTLTTNTGWTLSGTMSIAQNTWRDFIVALTSSSAGNIQSIGTGTQS